MTKECRWVEMTKEKFFIEDAVPGDVVNAVVIHCKKEPQHLQGEGNRDLSPERTTPFVNTFTIVVGAKWQNFKYDSQTKYKFIKIVNAMRRIGKDGHRRHHQYRKVQQRLFVTLSQ